MDRSALKKTKTTINNKVKFDKHFDDADDENQSSSDSESEDDLI